MGPRVLDQDPLPTRVFGQVGERVLRPPFPMQVMAVLTQQSWAGSLGLCWAGPELRVCVW